MSWTDPNVPMPPEGYGKFELNVHSNDCYTAGGPSKLVGFLTITDTKRQRGHQPASSSSTAASTRTATTAPPGTGSPRCSRVLGSSVTPDAQGRAGVPAQLRHRRRGLRRHRQGHRRTARSSGRSRSSSPRRPPATLPIPTAVPAGAKEVDFTITTTSGIATSSPATLPVQGG